MAEHCSGNSIRTTPLDEQQLVDLATHWAGQMSTPMCIHLEGDLGAGKTTFARALIKALGHKGRVKSPTYGILEHYALGAFQVLHLDLYRIEDSGELEFLGISDLFDSNSILLVEWPEKGGSFLPEADLVLKIEHSGDKRVLNCQAYSSSGNALCHYFNRLL